MGDIYDAFESWGASEYEGYDWVDTDLSEQKTYTLDEFKKESNILDTAEKEYEETLLSEASQYSNIQNNLNEEISNLENQIAKTENIADKNINASK